MPALDTRATSLLTAITEGGDFRLHNNEVLVITMPDTPQIRSAKGETIRFRGGWVAFYLEAPYGNPICVQLSQCLVVALDEEEPDEAENA